MAARKLVKNNATTRRAPANESEFKLDVWLTNSKKMIGQPRHIITGATYGRDEDELYSRSKMNELVKRFLTMR